MELGCGRTITLFRIFAGLLAMPASICEYDIRNAFAVRSVWDSIFCPSSAFHFMVGERSLSKGTDGQRCGNLHFCRAPSQYGSDFQISVDHH
jgi:hypothetical protein